MNPVLETLNTIFGTFGLVGIIVVLILFYDLRTKRKLEALIRGYFFQIITTTTISSSVLTLIYSEYFGILPCGLCWFERLLLYPQIILVLLAWKIKDSIQFPRYGLALSVPGLVISLYHHYIQMGGSQFIKCPATGVDCAKRFLFEYNFITFPLLSAILFAFLICVYIYVQRQNQTSN